jgi:hypothetical protein
MDKYKRSNDESFALLLDDGVKDAYIRPWHRIERGLRLNRLRLYIDEIAPEHSMSDQEKEALFVYFQKALDKKLLNTLKIVQYDQEKQKIISIKGFEVKRTPEGQLKWDLVAKKVKTESAKAATKTATTRKKKQKDTII